MVSQNIMWTPRWSSLRFSREHPQPVISLLLLLLVVGYYAWKPVQHPWGKPISNYFLILLVSILFLQYRPLYSSLPYLYLSHRFPGYWNSSSSTLLLSIFLLSIPQLVDVFDLVLYFLVNHSEESPEEKKHSMNPHCVICGKQFYLRNSFKISYHHDQQVSCESSRVTGPLLVIIAENIAQGRLFTRRFIHWDSE